MTLEAELEALVVRALRRALTEAEITVPPPAPARMSVHEFAQRVGISPSKVYALVKAGLPCVRVGRRILVDVEAAEQAMLAGR